MCNFYHVFAKENMIDDSELRYNLLILKDYILLWYGSIPRGKIPINSYFYKILEYVNINDFYMRGLY